jgi:hypothetical protein
LICILFFSYKSWGQWTINRIRADAKNGKIDIHRAFYNSIYVLGGESNGKLRLVGKGMEITKCNDSLFFVRTIGNEYRNYILLYNNDRQIDSILISVNTPEKLPIVKIVTTMNIMHTHKDYIYDSLSIIYHDYPDVPFSREYKGKCKKLDYTYKVLFYTVEIVQNGNLIFAECVNGNKYSDKFLNKIEDYRVDFRRRNPPITDVLHIKSIVIQDDLGNLFQVPDSSLDLRGAYKE